MPVALGCFHSEHQCISSPYRSVGRSQQLEHAQTQLPDVRSIEWSDNGIPPTEEDPGVNYLLLNPSFSLSEIHVHVYNRSVCIAGPGPLPWTIVRCRTGSVSITTVHPSTFVRGLAAAVTDAAAELYVCALAVPPPRLIRLLA